MSASTTKRKNVEDPLNNSRNNLLKGMSASGIPYTYIGISGIQDDFVWVSDGRLDKLLTKVDADELKEKKLLYRDDPGKNEEPFVDASVLAMVVHLDERGFFLIPDAGYKGPSKITKALKDAKMYTAGSRPGDTPFADDYDHALENVRAWMQRARVHTISKGVCGADDGIMKFRHVQFEDLAKSARSKDTDELPAIYKIANWPVETEEAKREIRNIEHTHAVVPLPAYDIRGNLISPDTYRIFLQRAVVAILFTLEHRAITPPKESSDKPSDVYSADILNMEVLLEPPPIRTSPKKPRLQLKNPSSLSSPKGKGKAM